MCVIYQVECTDCAPMDLNNTAHYRDCTCSCIHWLYTSGSAQCDNIRNCAGTSVTRYIPSAMARVSRCTHSTPGTWCGRDAVHTQLRSTIHCEGIAGYISRQCAIRYILKTMAGTDQYSGVVRYGGRAPVHCSEQQGPREQAWRLEV